MRLRSIYLSLCLLFIGGTCFSQVTISLPYNWGEASVKAMITYPANIKLADSVALEADYYSNGNFVAVNSAKGLPKQLVHEYSFANRLRKQRTYRVVVYQKGLEPVYSNSEAITYRAEFVYSTAGLPAVTNLKATVIEKDGAKYVHLTWMAVPNALAYRLYLQRSGEDKLYHMASLADDGYIHGTSYDYLLVTSTETEYTFAIGAVEGPGDMNDFNKLVNKVTIKASAY